LNHIRVKHDFFDQKRIKMREKNDHSPNQFSLNYLKSAGLSPKIALDVTLAQPLQFERAGKEPLFVNS
jgi:hypothetical protein